MRKSLFKLQILLFVFGIYFNNFAQEKKNDYLVSPNGDTIYIKPFTLSDITTNTTNSYEKIKRINESFTQNEGIKVFDSIYESSYKFVDSTKRVLYKQDFLSINELDYELNMWTNYLDKLEAWRERINDRAKEIEQHLFETTVLEKQWKLTLANAKQSGVPTTVLTGVNDLLKQVATTQKQLNERQTELLGWQNKVTEIRISIDEAITYLNKTRETYESDYFRTDSYPIWHVADTSHGMAYVKKLVSNSYKINAQQVNDFYKSNRRALIAHLALFILLWFGFYYLSREGKKIIADESFPEMDKTEHVLSMHTLSSMIIALFISIWIYQALPFILFNVIQLLYIVIAIFFLTRYIDSKLKTVLLGLLLLFFINEAQVFLFGKSLIARFLIFAENIVAAWVLYLIISPKYFVATILKIRHWGVFLKILPVFYLMIAISFLGNIFGYINLALLLNKTVVYALLNLNLLLLVIIVIQKSFSVLFRTPFFRKSNIIKDNLDYIEKRFFQTIQVIGVLFWLKSVLKTLLVYNDLYVWFSEVSETSWHIGNSTIAIGGLINFALVIIFTFLAVRFLKTILKEELYPRITLPRGVPGAISMIVGYAIVAYGFFIALGAAGVDLGQFGLIAGALGVGIGFGLQGIVANFIAGIVLAFERPIQEGDTIQIGTMMGDVIHIGVRASTIKTFDGSEVIIPNSSLITNDVTNWTLSNRKRRWDINVGVAYGSDPNQVLEIISDVANAHPDVHKLPAPWALFDGFGDSSLNFRIRIWTSVDTGLNTKSEVTVAIYKALQKAGIEIPFPQRDIYIKSLPKEKPETVRKTAKTRKPKENDTKK